MPMPPESHRLQPDHLPTPFSADQIRDASPVGRLIRVRTETPGEVPAYREIRYLAVDATGASGDLIPTDADGAPIGPAVVWESTWLDLQGHASQPADGTTLEETTLELNWGSEACWRYDVTDAADVKRFWFAQSRPGMPVLFETWEGGRLTERTEVMSYGTSD